MKKRTRAATVSPADLIQGYLRREHDKGRLSTRRFADSIGVSYPTADHWVSGRRPVASRHWPKVAEFFGFPTLEALLTDARDRHASTAHRG